MSAGKRTGRYIPLIALALFALFCRGSSGFATFTLKRLSRPAMLALNRLTARIPFPLCEPATFAAGAIALATLARAALQRAIAPLASWLRGASAAALALAWTLALLWLPAMAQPVEAPPAPNADQLEWLCGALIDQLNACPLAFPEPKEALRSAPGAAGLPGCAVKAARYPEWMRRAGISGMFAPPTGEAVVDALAPEPLIPFTAVHELMHVSGIADEGAANIAAWERCLAAGGPFADSARLWALRYALGQLYRVDPAAWQRVRGNMKDPLARVFRDCGGEASPRGGLLSIVPGFARASGDYGDLAAWLAR